MSKQVPIAISWFFNGNLIWHFSNEAKTEKMVTQNRLLWQKMQKNAPKMTQTLHLKSGNGPPRIYPWCMPTLDCLCGTLVGKTELKCTKNFKALYLNFTKCNGTGFWHFGTDMQCWFLCIWKLTSGQNEPYLLFLYATSRVLSMRMKKKCMFDNHNWPCFLRLWLPFMREKTLNSKRKKLKWTRKEERAWGWVS